MRPRLAALAIVQLIALSALAQEYGRVSGGAVELLTKQPKSLSGSLGMTVSNGKGYEMTLGGTVIPDRLWFFGTAFRNETRFNDMQMPRQAIDAKLMSQIGSRQSLAASYTNSQQQTPFTGTMPSTFLSLRYTGIVSSNMFFNVNLTRSSTTGLNSVGFFDR